MLACGVTLERKAALVFATGASVGLVAHSLLATAGLSAFAVQTAGADSVVKYVGVA